MNDSDSISASLSVLLKPKNFTGNSSLINSDNMSQLMWLRRGILYENALKDMSVSIVRKMGHRNWQNLMKRINAKEILYGHLSHLSKITNKA